MNKQPTKERSNSVKLTESNVLKEAKMIAIKKGYNTLGAYITEAVKEKNKRER